jgi:hypothetical protein
VAGNALSAYLLDERIRFSAVASDGSAPWPRFKAHPPSRAPRWESMQDRSSGPQKDPNDPHLTGRY